MSEDLEALERRSWEALATEGQARAFFEQVLDEDVVMLLPGGLVLADRSSALTAMSGPPWQSYRLESVQVRRPTVDTGLVTYSAVAAREGQPTYSALMSSLYVRRPDGWRLTFHQQTPR